SEELAAAMAPWMQYCIEQFGPERCMFESNFPPDKVSFSYHVLYNAFKRLSRAYSPSERAAMFHDTAVKGYRIAVSPPRGEAQATALCQRPSDGVGAGLHPSIGGSPVSDCRDQSIFTQFMSRCRWLQLIHRAALPTASKAWLTPAPPVRRRTAWPGSSC